MQKKQMKQTNKQTQTSKSHLNIKTMQESQNKTSNNMYTGHVHTYSHTYLILNQLLLYIVQKCTTKKHLQNKTSITKTNETKTKQTTKQQNNNNK